MFRYIFISRDIFYLQKNVLRAKTAVRIWSLRKVFLKVLQYPQENKCVVVSLFLIKLESLNKVNNFIKKGL